MKSTRPVLALAIVLLTGILWAGLASSRSSALAQSNGPEIIYRGTLPVAKFDVSAPLREIPPAVSYSNPGNGLMDDLNTGLEGAPGPQDTDMLVQDFVGPNLIPPPIISFNGPANISGVQPPDPNGDVGPNHVVVMSNLSFQIFDKTGISLYGPALNNTLWAGFGGACQTENSGDPIVLHDQFNDRWILSQFTSAGPTYYNCVAVSTTADPTGSYYRYAFSTGTNFPDYPKYGVWSNAYYISTREFAGGASFAGIGAYAIEIADVISGNPTPTVISFLATPGGTAYNVGDGLLPADLDGSTLPPSNVEYFMGSMDNGGPYGAPMDALTIWEFTPDFVTPANSTFVLANTIPISPYDTVFPCSPGSRDCIPQPGTAVKIDILSYRQRPLWRLAYRNFGSHESLVTNQSVEAAANMAGIRWWEIRDPGGAPVVYQEGTYAPGVADTIHRWMASVAMDGSGNMALSYSASNGTTTFPSVWYTGRLAGDPLGTMPQGEGSIVNGTGSQTSGARWGDYTSLTVDPVDDCTFWAVNQWVPVSGGNWTLRIGAFKFDECGSPDFTLDVTPHTLSVCTPNDAVYTATIGQVQSYTDPVTLSALGNPAGTTTSFTVNPVTPPGSSILTLGNMGAAAAGAYSIDVVGVAATSTHTSTVALDVFTATPGTPNLTSPANGAIDVPLQPNFQWDAAAQGASYFIEVATDAGFTNIVISDTTASTSYTPAATLADGVTYYWRVTASNTCGAGAVSATFSFTTVDFAGVCNPTAITIPDSGAGTPYPSNITVAITQTNLLDVNVQLFGLSHTWPDDVDMLLVGPQGQNLIIMSDAGGSTDVVNADVFFDDAAATGIPDAGPLVAGTYKPTNIGAGDTFPAPAPAPSANTTLATFNGTNPNGTWSLYVVDDAGGDSGSIAGGWCLELAAEAVEPAISVNPASLSSTQPANTIITETLTINNLGGADLNWSIDEASEEKPTLPVDPIPANPGMTLSAPKASPNMLPAAPFAVLYDQTDNVGTNGFPSQNFETVNDAYDSAGADDFVIPGGDGGWTIETVEVLGSYSTAGPVPTVDVYFYSDNVGLPGALVYSAVGVAPSSDVAGDLTIVLPSPALLTSGTYWVSVVANMDFAVGGQWFWSTRAVQSNSPYAWQNPGNAFSTGCITWAPGASVCGVGGGIEPDSLFRLSGTIGLPTGCAAPNDIPWVSVNPASGTTAPTGSDNVAVVFDSTGLVVGVYTGTLCINSNDPVTPLVTVPLTLTVAPVYGVALSADDASSGLPGDTVSYVVTITNTGDTPDTYDLSAASVWAATLSDASLTLGAGATTTFTVDVDVPAGALAGESDVATVTATSQADGSVTDDTLLTTTAEAVYDVAISGNQSASGAPGDTVSYIVTLTNTGNTTDTFDLAAAGAWTALLSDASVTLGVGEIVTVTVEVSIPAGAADNDFDVTTVTATSQNDPTAEASADLTTTAEVTTFKLFLPIVIKN